MSKVAVVILNWNGRKLLEQFLPSVTRFSSTDDVAVVVADNCSSDDSISFLKQQYPDVRLIELSENYGYADGYNKALEQVTADYFVLLNSDVEVSEGWLKPIVTILDKETSIVAAQPKILAQRNKRFFEYAGASGGFIDENGYPFCRGRIFDVVEEDNNQYDDVIDVFWASGACLFIRSSAYFEAGGLDASFFAHMEEIDLCWRLNARGKRVVCVPQSVVYHVGGATLNEDSPRKTFLNFRNNLLMLYKNLPDNLLKPVMNRRIFLDYLAAMQLFLKGRRANAKAIIAACKEFKKMKSDYFTVREDNLSKTTTLYIPTIYKRNILNDFYFKGNKLFSKLRKFN